MDYYEETDYWRSMDIVNWTTNPQTFWRLHWDKACKLRYWGCSRCKPHRGHDNKWSRHGRTDKYKSQRKGRC